VSDWQGGTRPDPYTLKTCPLCGSQWSGGYGWEKLCVSCAIDAAKKADAAVAANNDPTFKKDDSGKTRLDLLPFEALEEVGRVLTFGANDYGANNWTKGCDWSRYLGACLRHVFSWASGEDKDPKSGLSHLAHAVCCLLFLWSLQRWNRGTDDRVKMGAL
jgi:hypothetical protein